MDASGYPTASAVVKPDGAAKDILSTTSIRLRFSRFLLPVDTFRQSLCVQAKDTVVSSLQECTQGVFFEPAYDPIRREITYRQSPDTSKSHLLPNTTYWVTVFPPPDATSDGIVAFDGAPLDRPSGLHFTTLGADPPNSKVEPLPAPVFCSPDMGVTPGALDHLRSCATTGCHVNGAEDAANPGVVLDAPEGLDLSDIDPIRATAVSHVAHETQTGEHAARSENSGLRFGRAMPIVDPGNAGNSYLLYKIIVNRDNTTEPDADEVERLRASLVVGMPMPPFPSKSEAQGGKRQLLDAKALERLSAWITQGAPTPSCKKN